MAEARFEGDEATFVPSLPPMLTGMFSVNSLGASPDLIFPDYRPWRCACRRRLLNGAGPSRRPQSAYLAINPHVLKDDELFSHNRLIREVLRHRAGSSPICVVRVHGPPELLNRFRADAVPPGASSADSAAWRTLATKR
jgi:hypothetical protein